MSIVEFSETNISYSIVYGVEFESNIIITENSVDFKEVLPVTQWFARKPVAAGPV